MLLSLARPSKASINALYYVLLSFSLCVLLTLCSLSLHSIIDSLFYCVV